MAIACDTVSLLSAASCFNCLDEQQGEAIKTYLMCAWVNANLPATPTNLTIDPTNINSANSGTFATQLVWQSATQPANFEVWRKEVSTGDVYHLLATVAGNVLTYLDTDRILIAQDVFTFKVRGKNGTSFGAFSNEIQACNGITINGTGVTSVSFPLMALSYNTVSFTNLASCTTVNLPEFKRAVFDFTIDTCAALTSVNFPKLLYMGGETQAPFSITNCALLTTLSFANFFQWNCNLSLHGCTTLSSVTFNQINVNCFDSVPNGWDTTACALNATSVNNGLILLDNNGVSVWVINTSGGTNAAPTGAGITAKNDLIAFGNTVTTN